MATMNITASVRASSTASGRLSRPALLRKLDPQIRRRVQGAIALLVQDPRPPGARALKGRPGLRVRVGDYRLIYTVHDEVLLVVVLTLRHRRDVYDRCLISESRLALP